MCRTQQSGFTLIELSIVMVIVGLIASGVLFGRDLIRSAELRGDLSAVEKFDTAINTFRLKYNCIPGNCANAQDFLAGANDGDGDGKIEGGNFQSPCLSCSPPNEVWVIGDFFSTEYAYAIDDLARANLIATTPFDPVNFTNDTILPKAPLAKSFVLRQECVWDHSLGYCVLSGRQTYRLGVAFDETPFHRMGTAPVYTASDAYYVDTKIDDGIANQGRVTAAGVNKAGQNIQSMVPISVYFNANVWNCTLDPLSYGAGTTFGLTPTCDWDLANTSVNAGVFIRSSAL